MPTMEGISTTINSFLLKIVVAKGRKCAECLLELQQADSCSSFASDVADHDPAHDAYPTNAHTKIFVNVRVALCPENSQSDEVGLVVNVTSLRSGSFL